MSFIAVGPQQPQTEFDLDGTTLRRVEWPDRVDIVYLNALVDLYVYQSNLLDDGALISAAGTNRYRIPAGTCHGFRVMTGLRFLVATESASRGWATAIPPVGAGRNPSGCTL